MLHPAVLDPVALAQALIRCPSVTPSDAGALGVAAAALAALGFTVHHLPFDGTPNLFARRGGGGPHLCFAGHTDVVPAGEGPWSADPFAGTVRDGVLFGRGACDMKGAVAAFVAAVAAEPDGAPSVSLLLTGDEEGPATGGTVRVLEWMEQRGHIPDFCLVGEPTNPAQLGEVVKVGRRGSLNATITVRGTQGHVAYPALADNPVHRLTGILSGLIGTALDAGTEWFEPSSLQVTSVDVGNPVSNLVPAAATARLNIRFNDCHTGAALRARLLEALAPHGDRASLQVASSGDAFLAGVGPHTDRLVAAITAATGRQPRLDTGGGTSDARFIARYCPVAEFGLVGATMHAVDENVPVADLHALTATYRAVLRAFAG